MLQLIDTVHVKILELEEIRNNIDGELKIYQKKSFDKQAGVVWDI